MCNSDTVCCKYFYAGLYVGRVVGVPPTMRLIRLYSTHDTLTSGHEGLVLRAEADLGNGLAAEAAVVCERTEDLLRAASALQAKFALIEKRQGGE